MARDSKMYSLPEWQVAGQAETTGGTANTTTMPLWNLTGAVSVSENVYRSIEKRHNSGRTKKEADVKFSTKGQLKTVSGTSRLDTSQFLQLLENVTGLNDEVTGEVLIPYNYTSPNIKIGDTFTDNTGTFTIALISPDANQTQLWVGAVCTSLRLYADATSEGGYWFVDWEFTTKNDISDDQATPTGLVAYTVADKTIYDFCTASTWNSLDLQLMAFEITFTPNVQWGGSCATDYAISRGMDHFGVTGSITANYDDNTKDIHKDARTGDARAISLSDGSNFVITVAKAVMNADGVPSDSDSKAVVVIPWEAVAGTSGNLAEIEVA